MIKYSLFVTNNENLMSDLNETFTEASPCFGKSLYVIAFNAGRCRDSPSIENFVGMALIKSKWQPLEWQGGPFSKAFRGAFIAKWVRLHLFYDYLTLFLDIL